MILALQFSFCGLAPCAFSQALEETTALLNDQTARDKVVQGDPQAQQADQQVKALGLGSDGQAKLYELSGKILEKLSVDADGDSTKMNQKVQDLARDPSSLEGILTEDQKKQVHDLSTQAQPK